MSLIAEDALKGHFTYAENNLTVNSVTGEELKIQGKLDINLKLPDANLGKHRFLIKEGDFEQFQGILGTDWLSENEVKIDYKSNGIFVREKFLPFLRRISTNVHGLTSREKVMDNSPGFDEYEVIKRIKVKARGRTKLPTLTVGNLRVAWDTCKIPRDKDSTYEIYCEPRMRLKEDIEGLNIGRALVSGNARASCIPYANLTGRDVYLEKGDVVAIGVVLKKKIPECTSGDVAGDCHGMAVECHDTAGECRGTANECRAGTKWPRRNVDFPGRVTTLEKERLKGAQKAPEKEIFLISNLNVPNEQGFDRNEEINRLIETTVRKSECPETHKNELRRILREYRDILARQGEPVGLCNLYQPSITLDTDRPVYIPQYPVPYGMRESMKESVNEFLEAGIIQYSKSPYNAPTLMVKKKDGGGRMVVDYRHLNKHVKTDCYPLPRIAQILENLGGCKFFTTLDLLNGFYNLEIKPEDREKTAFSTYEGHYEFVRLPMGLKNSPSIFQRMMNIVLTGCLGKYAYIYIDDIVIYSKSAKEHLEHITGVLKQLRDVNLKIKLSKCQFFKTSVEYRGYIVSPEGLKVNPRKMTAISNFPTPTKVKDIQAFLGLVGYF